MNDPYEEYEQSCKAVREENVELLNGFEKWLREKGLSKKTIKKHVSNTDFYINECLCSEDPPQMAAEGVSGINYFLGYWFIRKAMWAGPTSIRENAGSLKKFYAYMTIIGQVEKDDYDELRAEIKEGLSEWIDTVKRYDDPDMKFEDVWQW